MIDNRRAFFERIADDWDARVDTAHLGRVLRKGLLELGISRGASVVDLGCGTGNLTAALMDHLDDSGRVVAVDFAPKMLERARAKVTDARVRWVAADAVALPLDDASADHVICFSTWPHFPEPLRVVEQIRRVLVVQGVLTIWHAISRDEVNAIHSEAGPEVRSDLLVPVAELARLLATEGFLIGRQIDDERYILQATWPGP